MAIQFLCPSGHRLSAPESRAGRTVRCPACKQTAVVPYPGAGKTAAEEPAQGAPAEASGSGKPPVLPPRPKLQAKPAPPKLKMAIPAPAPPVELPLAEPVGPMPEPPLAEPAQKIAGGAAAEIDRPLPKPPPPKAPPAPPADPPLAEPVAAPEAVPLTPRDRHRRDRRGRRRQQPELRPVAEPSEKQADGRKEAPQPKPMRTMRPRRRGWFHRGPKLMGSHVYQPDRGHLQTVRWLALILGAVVLFSIGPAVVHLNLETAPGWARAVLLMAAVQVVFILWMLATPDWASVWVLMLVFGFVATLYAAGTAVALATPLDAPMPLGMGAIRTWAAAWFAAVLAVECLATYLCGRTATRWRHSFRLEMAGRGGPSKHPGQA